MELGQAPYLVVLRYYAIQNGAQFVTIARRSVVPDTLERLIVKRWLALIGITAALAVGVTVAAPPGAAQAASLPGPINILPNVAKAGLGSLTGVQSIDFLAVMIYKAMQSPTAVGAAQAKLAGTTMTEAQLAAQAIEKAKFRMPSMPVGVFSKVAAGATGAGVALTGFQLGVSAGNGIGTAVIGRDSTGLICESVKGAGGLAEGFIGFVSGADCSAYAASEAYAAQANAGIQPGVSGGRSCFIDSGKSVCVELTGYKFVFEGASAGYPLYSFRATTDGVALHQLPGNGQYQNQSGTWMTWNTSGRGTPTELFWTARSGAGNYELSRYLVPPTSPVDKVVAYRVTPTATIASAQPTSTNPDRTMKCVIAGSNGQTYTASSLAYKETDTVLPDPVCPDLPAGVFPNHIKITQEGGGETFTIYETDATPEYKQAVTMPECMDGSCLLQLLRNGVSCFESEYACADWYTDPDRATTYTCRWGKNAVALERCAVYAPTFKPDANTKGELYGDPITGAPLKNPSQTSQADQTNQGECFPTGWGVLNPFEWVLKPVQCALTAAFVPKTSAVNRVELKAEQAFDGTAFATVGTATTTMFGAFNIAATGCSGPPWRLEALGWSETFYPFNACAEPVKGAAAFANGLISVSVVFLTVLSGIRYIAGTIGFVGMGSQMLSTAGGKEK